MHTRFLAGTIFSLSVVNIVFAGVQLAGVNIAGFDFGCTVDGSCIQSNIQPPVASEGGGLSDGLGQMVHFARAHNFNIFRLPVAWQYLVNNNVGGLLDAVNLASYDKLVQGCLSTGAHCIIDVHNYARWNGQIVGQGGPSNAQFASLWSQLATKYASESRVVMGLINEPHDLPDINAWAATVQAAVTAIRKAGATSHMILLPGTDYTSAGSFISSGSAAALAKVTNLDASTTNLIFDVHSYLDSDHSGTHASCVSNQISESFAPLATWLRSAGRMALLSETGGGSSDPSCLTYVCEALSFLNQNSDVYLGYLGWAAGSFSTSYVLSLTPFGSASTGWTDQKLLTECFAAQFSGGSGSGSGPGPGPGPAPTTGGGNHFTTSIQSSSTAAAVPTTFRTTFSSSLSSSLSSSSSARTSIVSASTSSTTAPASTSSTTSSSSAAMSLISSSATGFPLSLTTSTSIATISSNPSPSSTTLHPHRHSHHTITTSPSTFSSIVVPAPSTSSSPSSGTGVGNIGDPCKVKYVYV